MADIEDQLIIEGLDGRSAKIYMNSWRPATIKQYNTYLEKWTVLCLGEVVHPRTPSLIEIMRFLTCLKCDQHLSYSAINSTRSALSAYVQKIGGHQVGSHPEVVRHVKGLAKMFPAKPVISTTWDVNTVFILLKTWHPPEEISLLKLSYKTVMLLVLVLAQRAQTIALMKMSARVWLEERVLIQMKEMLKHNRAGQPLEVFQISRFNKDKRLCPVRYLKAYLKATKIRRGGR